MTTGLLRPEPLETLELRTSTQGATSIWRNRKVRLTASLAVISALCAVGGIVRGRSLRAASRPPKPVCSTIRGGPTTCITVDDSTVIATLRNEKNVEVCGDFRLELLRYDRHDRRLLDSHVPSRKGCLPANDQWDWGYAMRYPGIRKASGALRPYRYMCVTGYRMSNGRWLETGWVCQPFDRASVKK